LVFFNWDKEKAMETKKYHEGLDIWTIELPKKARIECIQVPKEMMESQNERS